MRLDKKIQSHYALNFLFMAVLSSSLFSLMIGYLFSLLFFTAGHFNLLLIWFSSLEVINFIIL